MNTTSDGIAIIGMSGRFPGAGSVDEFWRNLIAGVESISFFSDEELAAAGLDVAGLRKDPRCVAARGIVKDADWFDASFFNISAREAELTDPQQRIFLEASWEALENAGYDPARVKGYIGVYAGMSGNAYHLNNLYSRPDLTRVAGQVASELRDKDFLATRVAYKLNLRGPALSIHTACSTSLVAVSQACQALLCYQCDLALAGGVSISFPQKRAYLQEGGMLSPDGHCRPFDAQAAGTNFSDGLGIVVLKRLAEALDDGDQIYAVIKGFALNNDGSAKVGFAAPSVDGQAEVIALALAQAGVEPGSISYVEAHGTATPLGDPIEIAGLTQAFGTGASRKNFCAIGSVKGNIGHLDAAAGVAGLIKTALALKHKMLPSSLHFTAPNPKIDFAGSPFFVNSKLSQWKAGPTPRRAGVSGFGVGGTNAHVVLEEAPAVEPSRPGRSWQLLVLSAKTSSALDCATANLRDHLKANPDSNLADVAFTLQAGRRVFDHRRMLVCRDVGDAIKALEGENPKRVFTQQGKVRERPVVFMFPGQGAQYVNMGAELYRAERVFKEEIDLCAEILQPRLGLDLRQVLFPEADKVKAAGDLLTQTCTTQPALFVIEYALARLWMSWGVKPRAMIGHSVGEYVAGCLAGVFSLEDALRVVAGRARLVQAQPGGAMLAVRMAEREIAPLLAETLSIAAVNSSSLCVVSGPFDAVAELEARLKEQGVAARRLQTSHAFHSAMMDPVLEPLTGMLAKVRFHKPSIPYVSNVTGRWIADSEAADPNYWANHVRQTVRFADGVGELLKDPENILLEVGPGQTLSSLASQHPAKAPGQAVVSSFSASKEQEVPTLLSALGKLWLAGSAVDWSGFYKHEKRLRVALPTYPFERKRYWLEPAALAAAHPAPDEASAGARGVSAVGSMGTTDLPPTPAPTADARVTGKSPGAVSRKERILAALTTQFQELSSVNLTDVGPSASFMEMGLDSLFLGQAAQAIEKQFGVRVSFRQMLQETTTLNELADFLDKKLPADALSPVAPPVRAMAAEVSVMPGPSVLDAIQTQLQALARQLELLRQAPPGQSSIASPAAPGNDARKSVPAEPKEPQVPRADPSSGIALKSDNLKRAGVLTLPLSQAQMELWLAAEEGVEASCAFNQIVSIHLRCPVSLDALRQALQDLVNRHDALRTTFLADGSGQQIHPVLELSVPLHDFSALDSTESQRKLEEAITLEDETPFNFATGPLFRAQVFKLSETHHVLVVAAHHLALDGWSISVLLRELSALYPARIQGASNGLAPAMQFRDYLEWQTLPENRARFAEAESYWVRQFASPPDAIELPADRPRPGFKTYGADSRELVLSPELYGALKQAAATQGCTLFTYLFASLKVLLHRLTGETDLVVGIHAAGQVAVDTQKNPGSRSLVGHCVSLLPVRSQCNGNEPFGEYLKQINRLVLDAYEHQDYTFGSLVKKLNLPRDASRVPLMPLVFNFSRNNHGLRLPGSELVWSGKGFNFFDLNIEAMDSGEDLRICCRFNVDLFDGTTMGRWLGHWKSLIEGMLRNPDQAISMLPILNEAERRQLLVEWNQTRIEYPRSRCLHELIEEQVERAPDATAVIFEGKKLTYRQLDERANQLARYLQRLGVGPDTLVSICVERSLEMVVGLLGILKAGGAYVPMDPEYPKERLAFMLADAGAPILLTQSSLQGILPAHTGKVVRLDADWPLITRESAGRIPSSARAEHLAYMIYTSGSTGRPKGAMNTHVAIVNRLLWMQDAYRLTPSDRVLQKTPFSFDVSVWEFFWPLLTGAKLVVALPGAHRDAAYLADLIRKEEITTIHFVPSMLSAFLEAQGLELSCASLKRVICSGEALPYELQQRFFSILPAELHNLYGPTEAAVDVTYWACQRKSPLRTVPIGRPIANTQIYILDRHLQPTPIGVPGELHIGGIGLARGYFNRTELTAEKFIPDPFKSEPGARLYKTGDLARYLPDGAIEYLRRMDHQVKIRGFRIELGEIESVLAGLPGVREAVVVAREDVPGDKRLVAYLTTNGGEPVKNSELRGLLQAKLPDYMVPSVFVTLDRFPLTPNGKVDRKTLPAPDLAPPESGKDFVAPVTDMEKTLAGIWSQLLRTKQVGTQDNFFEAGGDSLLAIRLASKIKQALRFDLPARAIFQHPTIGELAKDLAGRKTSEPTSELIPLRMCDSGPTLVLLTGPGSLELFNLANLLPANASLYASMTPLPESVVRAAANRRASDLMRMEDLATPHVAALKKLKTTGPLLLTGYCFGGMLAYEVAQQLRREGRQVAGVVLLDTWMARPSRLWWEWTWIRGHIGNTLRKGPMYVWRKFRARVKFERDRIDDERRFLRGADSGEEMPWVVTERIYKFAMRGYNAQPLSCRGFVLLPVDDWMAQSYRRIDESMGAEKLFLGGVEVLEVPGDHVNILSRSSLPGLARSYEKITERFRPQNTPAENRGKPRPHSNGREYDNGSLIPAGFAAPFHSTPNLDVDAKKIG